MFFHDFCVCFFFLSAWSPALASLVDGLLLVRCYIPLSPQVVFGSGFITEANMAKLVLGMWSIVCCFGLRFWKNFGTLG